MGDKPSRARPSDDFRDPPQLGRFSLWRQGGAGRGTTSPEHRATPGSSGTMPSTAANRGCDSTSPFHLVASSRRKVLPLSLASGKRVSTTLALMVLLSLTVGMCLSRFLTYIPLLFIHDLGLMPSALKAPTRTRQRAVDPVILLPCGWQCPDNNVFLQRFQLCDELDWEAPLKDRVCTSSPASCGMDSKPIQDPWRDLSAIKGLLERVGRIKLHVHYVYTEIQHLRGGSFWEQSNIPEARNKRLNLEMFIRTAVLNSPSSVDFHFSLGSELADAQDYFDSMGVKCSDRREDILPRLPNVFVHHPRVQVATDLVFHADWLQKHVKVRRGIEEYVVLISDKMRGPFLEPGYLEQMRESLSSTSGVPPWFAPFLSKFARNRRLGVVGTMLSQEVSPHVQSDFLAFKVDSRDFASMMSSNFKFAQQAGKQKGVPEEELGLSTRVLAGGFALGSMFPAMDNFTFRHGLCAQKLDDPLGALPEDTLRQYASGLCRDIKHACLAVGLRLSGGSTPYTSVVSGPDPFPNPVKFFAGPVEKVVFALHGGELWQDGSIPADLRIDVEEKTKSALGLRPEQFGGYLRRFAPGTPQGCPRRF